VIFREAEESMVFVATKDEILKAMGIQFDKTEDTDD